MEPGTSYKRSAFDDTVGWQGIANKTWSEQATVNNQILLE